MQWPSYLYLLSYKYCKLQFYDQNICLVKVLIPHNTEYNIALCCSVIIGSYIWGEGWGGGWKRNACRVLLWNQEGNSYLEDWGVDGRIILKWILYIYIYICVCVCVCARVRACGFIWLRIWTISWLLWIQACNFDFHTVLGVYWLTEELLASRGRLCCVELVSLW